MHACKSLGPRSISMALHCKKKHKWWVRFAEFLVAKNVFFLLNSFCLLKISSNLPTVISSLKHLKALKALNQNRSASWCVHIMPDVHYVFFLRGGAHMLSGFFSMPHLHQTPARVASRMGIASETSRNRGKQTTLGEKTMETEEGRHF